MNQCPVVLMYIRPPALQFAEVRCFPIVALPAGLCASTQGAGVVDAAAGDRKLEGLAACWVTGVPPYSRG